MTTTETQPLVRGDLFCPACEYNLRGLSGQELTCPECGETFKRVQLLATRGRPKVGLTPEYGVLTLPALWLVVVRTGYWWWQANYQAAPAAEPFVLPVWGVVAATGWLWLMVRLWRRLGGLDAVGDALLLHLVLAVYVGAGLGLVGLMANMLFAMVFLRPSTMVGGLFGCLVLLGLLALARVGDRRVQRRCWRYRAVAHQRRGAG